MPPISPRLSHCLLPLSAPLLPVGALAGPCAPVTTYLAGEHRRNTNIIAIFGIRVTIFNTSRAHPIRGAYARITTTTMGTAIEQHDARVK